VAGLINKPRELLSCFLFGNMTVNVLFFAVASVFVLKIEGQFGTAAGVFAAAASFAVLVLFGEIFPKSLSYSNSKSISLFTALPAFFCMEIFRPIVFGLRAFIAEPVIRLALGPVRPKRQITSNEFKSLVEHMHKGGLISTDENRLLTEIIELGLLKVRNVMQPRVDMISCDVGESPEKARQILSDNRLTKMPVYSGNIDNITGIITLRDLLLKKDAALSKLIKKVYFVPEQMKVEALLDFFRNNSIDTTIVVDEYGGIAGWVTIEDVAEELLGPIETAADTKPIEQLGPFEYRLAGSLSIYDWAGSFGIVPDETKISTIAGLVTALLGKIPQTGDVAYLNNLKFTVDKVKKRRIESVILSLEPISDDD
jgi:CBS domain containing-hemolysin-like protein